VAWRVVSHGRESHPLETRKPAEQFGLDRRRFLFGTLTAFPNERHMLGAEAPQVIVGANIRAPQMP